MIAARGLSLTGVILALLVLAATAAMAAPRVTVNGQPVLFVATPIQLDGTVMVPVREIGQALDAEVYWNASTQTVTATRAEASFRPVLVGLRRSFAGVAGDRAPHGLRDPCHSE